MGTSDTSEADRFRRELARTRGFAWSTDADETVIGDPAGAEPSEGGDETVRVLEESNGEQQYATQLPRQSEGSSPIDRAVERADAEELDYDDNRRLTRELEIWRAYALRLVMMDDDLRGQLSDGRLERWVEYPEVLDRFSESIELERFDASKARDSGRRCQERLERADVAAGLVCETVREARRLVPNLENAGQRWRVHLEATSEQLDVTRGKLLRGNIRLVWKICHRARKRLGHSAALRAGFGGLNRALDKFETRRGNKLSTYAYNWVRQRVTRASSDNFYAMRLPVHWDETRRQVWRVVYRTWAREGRRPALNEIASELDESVERIERVIRLSRYHVQSTDRAHAGRRIIDRLPDPNRPPPGRVFAGGTRPGPTVRIWRRLEELTDVADELEGEELARERRNRKVMWHRKGLGIPEYRILADLGDEYDVTRERIRQIETKESKRLRRRWPEDELRREISPYIGEEQ